MKYRLENGGKVYEIDVELTASGCLLREADGKPQLLRVETRQDGSQHVITPWADLEVQSARRGAELFAKVSGRRLSARVERARPLGGNASNGASAGAIHSPMAGKLLRIEVQVGDSVKAGQGLAVIEAMKMENELVAPLDGVVIEVAATAPSAVERGALLVRLEPV
jgi:biotin carboxyl carrier protein